MEVEQADVLKWAAWYSGPKFHAILTDPPYHLTPGMVRPRPDLQEYDNGNGNPYARQQARAGFMGKTWDGGDIAFQPSTWAALAEHLLPGAFGMVFASARGWHRLAVAIEDAGLIIHPSIFGYSYGSGFPKATRVKDRPAFEGHRYGLQALKPALEPIIVFQKPYEGRPVECITSTGAGALWIEGGRIGTGGDKARGGNNGQDKVPLYGGGIVASSPTDYESGRWPANFILSTSAAERLDEMSGESKSSDRVRHNSRSWGDGNIYGVGNPTDTNGFADSGGASRFFFRYVSDALDEADPVRYVAKASRRERDAGLDEWELKSKDWDEQSGIHRLNFTAKSGLATNLPRRNPHPTIKPIALARYLATLLLPPAEYAPRRILCPFAGAGSEMIGAMQAGWEEVTGIELEAEYAEIARARLEYWANQKPAQIEMVMK